MVLDISEDMAEDRVEDTAGDKVEVGKGLEFQGIPVALELQPQMI